MAILPSFGYSKGNKHFQTVLSTNYTSIHLEKIIPFGKTFQLPCNPGFSTKPAEGRTKSSKENPETCFVQKSVFWNKGTWAEEFWCSFIPNPPESLSSTGISLGSSPPCTWELQCTEPRVAGIPLENTEYWWCWISGEGGRKPTPSLFSLKGQTRAGEKVGNFENHSTCTPRITESCNPTFRHHSEIISSGHNLILSRMIWKSKHRVCLWKSSFREGKCPWKSFLQVIRVQPNIGMSRASQKISTRKKG